MPYIYFTEQEIDRKICLSILAYQGYSKSPTVTGEDGKILPADESVVAKKDGNVTVGVCYTPITACYTHAFGDDTCETNKIITENLRGWSSLTDNMFMYTYGTNFSYLTFPYNNWQFMADTFKFYEENNVRFLFDQSDSWNGVGPMSEMRSYVRSKLAWDASLNAEDLMQNYGYQYPDFLIVGDDLLLVVREASGNTVYYHNANYISCFVIDDFRSLLS